LQQQKEILKKDKELMQKPSFEIGRDLNDRKLSLSKLNFQMDVLGQKFQNTQSQLHIIQDKLRETKIVKINEGFQDEFAKANEERSTRVKELEKTIVNKNKRI